MNPPTIWRISSYSTNGGSCVAVADLGDTVAIRNSNHPDRATLALPAGAIAAFIAASKSGEYDDLG